MNDDKMYLLHIGECIARIESYVAGGRAAFMTSTLIQDAVVRNLQVMSESTQRLSDAIRQTHPEVDWRDISGFRNVLVHDYLGVDLDIVWGVVVHDLAQLKSAVQQILSTLPN